MQQVRLEESVVVGRNALRWPGEFSALQLKTHANRQDGGEEDNSFTDKTTHEAETTTKRLQFQQSEEQKIYSSLCSKDLFFSF